MDSNELVLDDDTLDPTGQVPKASTHGPRIATGSIAPPFGELPIQHVDDLETLRSLATSCRSSHAWHDLARVLRQTLDVGLLQDTLGEDETIELYAQLGELEGDVLGNVEDAIAAWRSVVSLDASDERALAALEQLLMRAGRWVEAVEAIERRALVTEDEVQRQDMSLQAASIWEERVEDLARATDIYERVRAADPTNAVAGERLAAIYRQERRWAELVEILLERSELLGVAAQQIELLHQIAGIYEHELDDTDSAFYVLQAAFDRDYAHARTGAELERLSAATGRWQELLDEYTKRVGELERAPAADLWVCIARWYGHQAQSEYALHSIQQALRLDPAHAGALASLADVQRSRGSQSEKQNDIHTAIEAYEQALAHDPQSASALAALDRLYRRNEAWGPLVDILARRARLVADDDERVALWLELGAIHHERLRDAAQALAVYRKVIELEPANAVALRALETLYERSDDHASYLAILEAQIDGARSDSERISLYERIAAAWEERLGKLDRAAAAYEQIVELDPRNVAAYHLLARVYQKSGRHDALVETYRRHIAATNEVEARVELYLALARSSKGPQQVEAYEHVLALDEQHVGALEELGKLYEHAGEWQSAHAVLARLVELCEETRTPDVRWRIGRIQYTHLGEAERGEATLLRGLVTDPGHLASMEVLIDIYAERGDWLKAAQMMVRAETHTRLVVDKVELLCEAANIYRSRLGQADQAKQLYAATIALDPEHIEAGRHLAELCFDAGQWTELSPVIDMLCRKLGERETDASELLALYLRAARCADELGELTKALSYYGAARDVDATHLPALIGRADLLFKMQDWASVVAAYQSVLLQRRGRQDLDDARVCLRVGLAQQELGQRKNALAMFHRALEIDPQHRDALHAIIDVQTKQGDWQAVVSAKRGLLESASARDRAALLGEIAAIYRDQLRDPAKARAAYVEAVAIVPDDRQLLQKVLDLCTGAPQWEKAVETIERFVAIETDPFRRGLYFHAAATLCRDELKALDKAVTYFDCALDSFFAEPERLDDQQLQRAMMSFEAIDAVLTITRDWKGQERAYRDMIKRLPSGKPAFKKLHVGLLDGLGEIYRSRLKQYTEATDVIQLAQQLDPNNELRAGADRAEILGELYVMAGPDHADKAIAQHALMLRREPFNYDSYNALARIYASTQQYDKYWCVSSTLAFLRKAEPAEQQFYEQYKPRGLVKAARAMTADTWAKLAHRDENRYISAIFGACWQGVAAFKAFPHKDFGLKRQDRRQLESDQLMFSRLFLYLSQVMNVQLPEIHLVDDQKHVEMQLANAIDKRELCPTFIVRPHMLHGKNEREVAFLSARRLAFMRPEYYLRMLLPTYTELKVVLLSAISMLQPGFAVPTGLEATVRQYVAELKKCMPVHVLEQLGMLVHCFIQASPELDLATWGHAVDAASHRVGFLMCGDLVVAGRAIAAEQAVVGGPSAKDKLRELVLFSVTEEFFAARAQLGITIG